jgi:hypothetical protein
LAGESVEADGRRKAIHGEGNEGVRGRGVVRVEGRGGEWRGGTGKGTGRKRQGGDERGKGGKWGQRPDEDVQMERPFGSSERVSKSDPFSSNNRLSISRTFPGTPPNNHILPFPDVLAQTPRFNYPLIRLRSAALAPFLIRPELEFPSISTPSPQTWKNKTKTKQHHHRYHYLPSMIHPLSLRPLLSALCGAL